MPKSIGEMLQTADWKKEKHVPVIECLETVKKGEWAKISVTIGKEIDHPNTTEHHIRWIRVYFTPEESKFAYDVGNFEFNSHGESPKAPNGGPVYTHSMASFMIKINESGIINAVSYCNLHGLWESKKQISVN
jgi:superoxide reductase